MAPALVRSMQADGPAWGEGVYPPGRWAGKVLVAPSRAASGSYVTVAPC